MNWVYQTPECCEAVKENLTVVLRYDEGHYYGTMTDKPKWKSYGWNSKYECHHLREVKFCPHCGTPTPKIRLKKKSRKKICTVSDGGYYCDTCDDRLNECQCAPQEALWEIDPAVKKERELKAHRLAHGVYS